MLDGVFVLNEIVDFSKRENHIFNINVISWLWLVIGFFFFLGERDPINPEL